MLLGWRRWIPALLWMAVIFAGSAQPVLPVVDGQPNTALYHRIGHVAEYGVLALCLAWALGTHVRGLLSALALAIVYAATDEYHQTFVPGRQGRVDQVLLDAAAAAGALFLVWVLLRLASRRATGRPAAAVATE